MPLTALWLALAAAFVHALWNLLLAAAREIQAATAVATAIAAGLLLGVGGPKRLVLAALAAAAIVTSGTGSEAAALVGSYTIVATPRPPLDAGHGERRSTPSCRSGCSRSWTRSGRCSSTNDRRDQTWG